MAIVNRLAFVAAAASVAGSVKTSPIDKVVTMLKDLQTKVQGEGKTEAGTYDTFACFCKDETKTKSGEITDSGLQIETLAASIADDTASKKEKEAEVEERKKKQEELSAEYREIITQCLAKTTDFEYKMADLSKAVDSLGKAIAALEGAKSASLLSLRHTITDSLKLADALGLVVPAKAKALTSFLQQGVDPDDPAYKFHSGEIVKLLKTLEDDFTQEKDDTQKEWDKSKSDCDDLKKPFSSQMQTNADAIVTLKTDIDGLFTKIAKDREDLITEQGKLKDSQTYLKDLTKMCEEKATEWDQRSSTRGNELKVIAEALAILENGKSGDDGFRAVKDIDAAVAANAASQAPTMLQAARRAASVSAKDDKPKSFLQIASVGRLRGQTAKLHHAGTDAAVQLLRSEGDRLRSPVLSTLASQITSDPFGKVKYLITKLIKEILDEAAQEATKKGFCDSEIAKASGERDQRMGQISKLTALLKDQEAEKKRLDLEIVDLKKTISDNKDSLNTTTEARETEHDTNMVTIEDAEEGVKALNEAIDILKQFYDDSYKAAFVQKQPVVSAPDAGFDGHYKGDQEGGGNIIQMLETIRSDFQRALKQVEESEHKAHRDFVELDRSMKVSIKTDETGVEQAEEDIEVAKNTIKSKTEELESKQSLLDDALKTLEDLKPMCIDTGNAAAVRKEQREEEVAALKKALCYLDPEKTEDDCKTA